MKNSDFLGKKTSKSSIFIYHSSTSFYPILTLIPTVFRNVLKFSNLLKILKFRGLNKPKIDFGLF